MVGEVMTPELIYCFVDQDMTEAARTMSEYQVRRLPILDREKRLVGVVSLADIALRDTDLEDEGLDEEVLENVSAPA
jgi:Mg/Co/Ni transporter MgtE